MTDKETCPKCAAPPRTRHQGFVNTDNEVFWSCGSVTCGESIWKVGYECLERQLAQAQEVIDKLPKTADGVPVVPGMEVFLLTSAGMLVSFWKEGHLISGKPHLPTTLCWYSTPEAAKVAREAKL